MNEFERWAERRGIRNNPFINEPAVEWCKAAFEAGQQAERKACALVAQSFQIAHCKSHHDDTVDITANNIKEAILDRS